MAEENTELSLQDRMDSPDPDVRSEARQELIAQARALAAAAAPVAAAEKPTTTQIVEGAKNAVSGGSDTKLAKFLSDPANAAAILGGGAGLYRTGASLNPLRPNFLKHPGGDLSGLRGYVASQALHDTGASGVSPEAVSEATGKPIRTMSEAQIGLEDLKAKNAQRIPVIKTVNGVPTVVGYRHASGKEATPLVTSSLMGKAVNAIEPFFPGVRSAANFVKGALPTIKAVGQGAGVGLGIGDVASHLMQGDNTGAGISGLGAVLAGAAAPELAIPIGLSASAINYAREHPEIFGYHPHPEDLGEYKRNFEQQKIAPPSEYDALGNPTGFK
jgi:hypothetical protein